MFARFWRWLRGLFGATPEALPAPHAHSSPGSARPKQGAARARTSREGTSPPTLTSRERTAGFRTRKPARWPCDEQRLDHLGLPVWRTETDLAQALDLTQKQLRFFATHRPVDRFHHYLQFAVPKARGGERILCAPKRQLKAVQRQLVRELVRRLPVSEYAHGFRQGRSVATNAAPHVGKAVVIRLDLADFFGTVTFPRVRGLLASCGYGHAVASSLALLATEAHRQPLDIDGVVHFAAMGPRHCVQGAPTSPGLCNAIARRLDHRLAGLGRSLGFAYTRYADDMVFSGDALDEISRLLGGARNIVANEGFRLNDDKTRIMRAGGRQQVTGVTVNQVLGLSRKERRKLRAALHQQGLARKEGKGDARNDARIQGKLAWLQMLNADQAAALHPQSAQAVQSEPA